MVPERGPSLRRGEGTPVRGHVRLLGGFSLTDGDRPVSVPATAQRLVAYLALVQNRSSRQQVAEALWPGAPGDSGMTSLRTALYRLRQRMPSAVSSSESWLCLDPFLEVDVAVLRSHARLLAADGAAPDAVGSVDPGRLTVDLLPGWDEPWVAAERARQLPLRLHALEAVARRRLDERAFLEAIEILDAAVGLDGLRETPRRLLAEVHLAEGNHAEALAVYRSYERLLRAEIGVAPSPVFTGMVAGLLDGVTALRPA